MGMIQKQVIVEWYTPEEKCPEEDIAVVCTISGEDSKGLQRWDHALQIMYWGEESGWYNFEYDFDELTVHAWCDLEEYGG